MISMDDEEKDDKTSVQKANNNEFYRDKHRDSYFSNREYISRISLPIRGL